jgi:hypothetical protein
MFVDHEVCPCRRTRRESPVRLGAARHEQGAGLAGASLGRAPRGKAAGVAGTPCGERIDGVTAPREFRELTHERWRRERRARRNARQLAELRRGPLSHGPASLGALRAPCGHSLPFVVVDRRATDVAAPKRPLVYCCGNN